jgi:lipoyl synthase
MADPTPLDFLEPERVAEAVKSMGLRHAVITSVNRDERRDGGAPIFALVIERIRAIHPGCSIEVLIPRFQREPGGAKDRYGRSPRNPQS